MPENCGIIRPKKIINPRKDASSERLVGSLNDIIFRAMPGSGKIPCGEIKCPRNLTSVAFKTDFE